MPGSFSPLSVSAPSKLILHGEHAVVYGFTAVAASLELRTSMTLAPHPSKVVVHFPDLGLTDSWSLTSLQELLDHCPASTSSVCPDFLERLHAFLGTDPSNLRMAGVLCFLYLYSVILAPSPLPMEIRVSSEIPLGAGLGSSAALSVCLAAGLRGVRHQVRSETDSSVWRQVRGQEPCREEEPGQVCQLALLSEKILHGTPSGGDHGSHRHHPAPGIDNSVSCYGGLCQLSQGSLTVLPSPQDRLAVLLVNTRVPRATRAMVAKVRAR